MPVPARILIADDAAGQKLLTRALEGYELFCADTLQQASRLLIEDGFDLVVCGIHFDDSRMVELCRYLRKEGKETPFVVVRVSPSKNQEILRQSTESLRKTLTMGPYIEFDQFSQAPNPVAAMREAIEKSLPKEKVVAQTKMH